MNTLKNVNVILLNELIEKINSFRKNNCSLSDDEKILLEECLKKLYALKKPKSKKYDVKADLMAIVDIILKVFAVYDFLKNFF